MVKHCCHSRHLNYFRHWGIGTIVAIETIVAIGNSVLQANHHRFLYIVIVAIGSIITTVAIGVIVAIETIVTIGVIVAIGNIVQLVYHNRFL